MRFVKVGLIALVAAIMYSVYGCVKHYQWEAERADPVKRKEMTLRECEENAKGDPNNAGVWCTWGSILVDYGREEPDLIKKRALLEEARQKAETAIRCDTKHTEAWVVGGHALYNLSETEADLDKKRKQLTEAVSKYEKATQLKPDYINAWFNLGCMKKKLAVLENAAQKQEPLTGGAQTKNVDPEQEDPKAILLDCARVAAAYGNKEACRAMLEEYKKTPGSMDERQLQTDPAFDSVRAEEWFKAL